MQYRGKGVMEHDHHFLDQVLLKLHGKISTDGNDDIVITVFGVGSFGAKSVRILAENTPGIICYEVVDTLLLDVRSDSPDVIATAVENSDLIFIISSFEQPKWNCLTECLIKIARQYGVLTVFLAEDIEAMVKSKMAHGLKIHVSADSDAIPHFGNMEPMPLQCHLVATIATVITKISFIGVDFADIKHGLSSGDSGWLGVGVANGDSRGRNATLMALKSLHTQRVNLTVNCYVIACMHGSKMTTMDDFDDVYSTIKEHVPNLEDIVVGCVTNDLLGDTLGVSLIVVS